MLGEWESERVGTFPVEQLKYSTHMICYVSYIMCVCVCVCQQLECVWFSMCSAVCAGLSNKSATAAHCKLFNKATVDRIMGKQLYAHIVYSVYRQQTEGVSETKASTTNTHNTHTHTYHSIAHTIHICAQQYGNLFTTWSRSRRGRNKMINKNKFDAWRICNVVIRVWMRAKWNKAMSLPCSQGRSRGSRKGKWTSLISCNWIDMLSLLANFSRSAWDLSKQVINVALLHLGRQLVFIFMSSLVW